MPDDTRPYKAVFEEGRAEGNTLVGEIKENPEKDIPLAMKREILRKKLKRQLTVYILKKRMKLWINWQTSW